MILDTNSLERLIPGHIQPDDVAGQETLLLHLERYEFAAKYIRPGRLLDIACGGGYGTRLLVDRCRGEVTALGVDISGEAITYARKTYGTENIQYVVADASGFTDPHGFDTIVSLETIEHLPDPEAFVANLVKLLRPDGILIASVPITPSVDANPYHLHDFTERSFRRVFARYHFKELDGYRQIQPFKVISLLSRKGARTKDIRRNLPLYYLFHPHSFVRRIFYTLSCGFANQYITIAWQATDET